MNQMKQTKQGFLKRFAADTRGSVLIIFGLAAMALMIAAGMGVDLGSQQLLRQKVQHSVDAAATSAGGLDDPSGGTLTNAQRTAAANRYFRLNFPSTFNTVARPAITVGFPTDQEMTVASVGAHTPTSFISNVGITQLPADASSRVGLTATAGMPYDIFLVIDNSGSMSLTDGGSGGMTRLQALKNASIALTNSVLTPANAALPADKTNRIGAVTWDNNVRATLSLNNINLLTTSWINTTMVAAGGTNASTGLSQAQTMGSTTFRPGTVRAIVLLTDGDDANPTGAIAACNSLKSMSPAAVVYTIAYGASASSSTSVKNYLSNCASGVGGGPAYANLGTYFYIAPTGPALNSVFLEILTSVKKIRIKE